MPLHAITTLDDPRLAPYRTLKDRDLAAREGLFIAEGEHLVRRLIASSFRTSSILLADRRVAEIAPLAPAGTDVLSAPQELMNQIVGFKFHSGVIAAGVRKPSAKLDDVLAPAAATVRLVVCPDIASAENLGSLVRLAAGFGADAMLLGPRSIDPFIRQAVRVSMGAVFQLPILQSTDLAADLTKLKQRWGVRLIASVLDNRATLLPAAQRHDRTAILFGGEAQGLAADMLSLCDDRVTIAMHRGTDSLNVAVAAGIFLYHYWA